jgi:hypothetical protein
MKAKLNIENHHSFKGEERNLFIISTLFQLLGAIEAQKKLKTKNNILVLLFYGDQNLDQTQLKNQLSSFQYDKLIILDKRDSKSYINLNIALIKELRREFYINVFVGFFSTNIRRFIANIHYKKLFLLDDGVYTIAIHNELYNVNAKGYKKYILPFSEKPRVGQLRKVKFIFYNNFRKFYLLLHGYRNDMSVMKLNFFTIFNLSQYQNELILNHNFNFLKSCYCLEKNNVNKNIVYFLGQPLDRSLEISIEDYLIYIQMIIKQYKKENKRIIYIAHRAENRKILDKIQKFNIELIKPKQSFEFYCLDNNIKITHISSFHSTALFSIQKIFVDVRVDAFRFKVYGINSKNLDLLYKMLNCIGAKVFYL